jgi:hypothetical protein
MQRALIAFGGGAPDHLVGTAEIVVAMSNTYRDGTPYTNMAVFEWAATDAMAFITSKPKADVAKAHGWQLIEDAAVLKPGGEHHEAYVTMATAIRRMSIAAVEHEKHESPRAMLEPLAAHFINVGERRLAIAREHPDRFGQAIPTLERHLTKIHEMFPGAMKLARSLTKMPDAFYEKADEQFRDDLEAMVKA